MRQIIKKILSKITSDVKFKGEYILTFADISSHPEGPELERRVVEAAKHGWEEYRRALTELHTKCTIRRVVLPIPNLVVDDGLEIFAQRLASDNTFTGNITHCALGTGTAGVLATDTQLGTEVFRKALSSNTSSAKEAFLSTFFTATDDADTYNEVGHFIDGTATVNSGQLFSRIEEADTVELPVTKTLTDTLTVDYKVTISNA